MRLVLLTCIVMVAFAANSVLTRQGIAVLGTDPILFAVIRVLAAVVALWALVWRRGGGWPPGPARRRWGGSAALALYMAGFSLAYLGLDAGVGALILFGGVQITMFGGALLAREPMLRRRVAGALIALAGLAVLVWPQDGVALPVPAVGLMLLAAFGWGVYSLLGRGEPDPLPATAANFALCLPMLLPLLWWAGPDWTAMGLLVAVIAGAVTSGLGYALWYAVLPALGGTRAAVAQLSVPVIAALGGIVLLGEAVDLRFWAASALVLGGIAVSLAPRR